MHTLYSRTRRVHAEAEGRMYSQAADSNIMTKARNAPPAPQTQSVSLGILRALFASTITRVLCLN
jgi:hypothetical protein